MSRSRGRGRGGNQQKQNKGQQANQQQSQGAGRKKKRSRGKKQDPAAYWGDPAKLPDPESFGTSSSDTAAIVKSLGRAPIPGTASEHYFTLMYERAAQMATILSVAGGLDDLTPIEPDPIDDDDLDSANLDSSNLDSADLDSADLASESNLEAQGELAEVDAGDEPASSSVAAVLSSDDSEESEQEEE